jgi:hypothetical protein
LRREPTIIPDAIHVVSFIVRSDLDERVDDAALERLLHREHAAAHHDLARGLHPDDARQPLRAARAGEEAEVDLSREDGRGA